MEETGRKITKIARAVEKFTLQNMRRKGVGTAEFDVIHLVRHNPGHLAWELVQLHNQRNIRLVCRDSHRTTCNRVET